MLSLGLYYKTLCCFTIPDFLELWEESQALSFIKIYIT